uniref:(northern house mosquito) hypothetical protein n=1 Tax=Culex pipiens TaxID=7175 RepID=A0A8D8K128_CULPI
MPVFNTLRPLSRPSVFTVFTYYSISTRLTTLDSILHKYLVMLVCHFFPVDRNVAHLVRGLNLPHEPMSFDLDASDEQRFTFVLGPSAENRPDRHLALLGRHKPAPTVAQKFERRLAMLTSAPCNVTPVRDPTDLTGCARTSMARVANVEGTVFVRASDGGVCGNAKLFR